MRKRPESPPPILPPAKAVPATGEGGVNEVWVRESFAQALPRIEGMASAYLGMRHGDRKDEAIAEVVAISWKEYRQLALRGRAVEKLLGKIVWFAAKSVRSGRRLVGSHPIGDVMSPRARFRHGYSVGTLPHGGEEANPEAIDALRTRTAESPEIAAAFRVDLEEWLKGLGGRERRVARQLLAGSNGAEVARRHGVSRTMIYFIRRDLRADWEEFHHTQDRWL